MFLPYEILARTMFIVRSCLHRLRDLHVDAADQTLTFETTHVAPYPTTLPGRHVDGVHDPARIEPDRPALPARANASSRCISQDRLTTRRKTILTKLSAAKIASTPLVSRAHRLRRSNVHDSRTSKSARPEPHPSPKIPKPATLPRVTGNGKGRTPISSSSLR
jgi:hypothetical protein